jgi:hypothetical protein
MLTVRKWSQRSEQMLRHRVFRIFLHMRFEAHWDLMVTVSFKIQPSNGQPARNVEIVAANPPHWVLKTPQGDKTLTLP